MMIGLSSPEKPGFFAGTCTDPARQKRDVYPDHSSTPYQTGIMMEISCRQCGQCCSTMGQIIRIMEQTGRFEYRIEYIPTGISQLVRIDPDKYRLFDHAILPEKRSLACPFLRIRDDLRVICTIHLTRPDMCRMYFCEMQKGREHDRIDPVTGLPE